MIKKKRLEIYWSVLNAHCTRRKATLYFSPAIAATLESLVMDIVMDVLIRFPIIAQRSKGAHYFHRVVGLVVINTCQWFVTVVCDFSVITRLQFLVPFKRLVGKTGIFTPVIGWEDRPHIIDREFVTSAKKFANFNEFSEIKKFVKKFVKCPSGRGLPTTTEEYDAFHGFMFIKI